jgi:predicted metal-dependent hydrolase
VIAHRTAASLPTPRNLHFELGGLERHWHSNDAFATAFYNALSLSFPKGELFFIESVRRFRAGLPKHLGAEVDAFVQQEAYHTREHAALNCLVERQGYDVAASQLRIQRIIDMMQQRNPLEQLALTVAFEHVTAILARVVLRDEAHIAGMPVELRRLWIWHATEEVEHRSVAFDVYIHVTRSWSRARRYLFRCRAMLIATKNLINIIRLDMMSLLEQDTVASRARGALSYVLLSPGLVRQAMLPYLGFFRPGFRP